VSCFSAETQWAPMLGYPKIQKGSPNTWEGTVNTFKDSDDKGEDKESPKDRSNLKSCESFYTCPWPPFIGRWRDFYILKTPSSSRNIPNVNIYMNVFYIPYIYKPATSSHAKPGLLETTSLTLLLPGSWISPFRKSSCVMTSELDVQQILELHRLPISWLQVHGFGPLRVRDFEASQVQDFRSSHVRDFVASQVQDSGSSHVRDSEASQVQDSRSSHVRDFATSQVQDSRSSRVLCSWKLISQTSWTSTFRGWQVFLNFPTSHFEVFKCFETLHTNSTKLDEHCPKIEIQTTFVNIHMKKNRPLGMRPRNPPPPRGPGRRVASTAGAAPSSSCLVPMHQGKKTFTTKHPHI
jgi:hypothetical protein